MDVALPTRPVRPDDLARFARLWSRLSPDTIHRRFHAPLHHLPPETVRRFVEVDHDRREALVATVGDEVVGVARYDRSPDDPGTAEFAIVVEDAWQGAGVGRQLLRELAELAARRGVGTFTATVQPDNERVIGLIRRVLPGSTFRDDDDVAEVRSSLRATPPAPSRAPAPVLVPC